jgi:hypothetical protein
MITKEEYLKALETVVAYNNQLADENALYKSIIAKRKDVMLSEFIQRKKHTFSTRLYGRLKTYLDYFGDCQVAMLLKSDFTAIRNAGEGCWHEFDKARKEFLSESTE